MPYFLDGNNLIGRARGVSRPAEEDRQALVSELTDRLRRTSAKAVLFFDGPGTRSSSLGSLSIRECGPTGADEEIVRQVRHSRASGEIVVVTADRGLAARCRDAGAKISSPGEFWSRFGVSDRNESRVEEKRVDVEEWMRYFEDEGNREE